jgi:hypothetical protein
MYRKLKYLINANSVMFSKAFLYSQSTAVNVILDVFKSLVNKSISENKFKPIRNSSGRKELPIFEVEKRSSGAVRAGVYYEYYHENSIPVIFREIVENNIEVIRGYLGADFLYEPPLFFRTKHIPDEFENFDIYSNVWHQDSHDGNRLLKIFVLLMDVAETDGPFIYMSEENTVKYWDILRERWTFDKFKEQPTFAEQESATGLAGDYLIIDTSRCMHRASNPAVYRDMVQITLYPSWRKSGERRVFPCLN